MEASALQAPVGLTRSRIAIGASLLRLRSDEQLVALFRAGHDEAFGAIHDRYRQRLLAYTRQMLPRSGQDAEDALQEVFVRAYAGLRTNDRELALRAWLYRVAHNRCIDELRRPSPPKPEALELVRPPVQDPVAHVEQREALRRLIADVRRLPDQQRSALLMRELGGVSYSELAGVLGVSVPAVKSLLVRARVGIGQSLQARETACSEIRDDLILAHDRGIRPNATARRHMRDCAGCRQFRLEMRGVSRQLAALVPALGPLGVLAKLLGLGGGSGGSVAAGAGAVAAAGTGGAVATGGVLGTAGCSHIAALVAAAVLTAGGAVEIQRSIASPSRGNVRHHAGAGAGAPAPAQTGGKADARPAGDPAMPTAAARGSLASPRSSRVTATSGGLGHQRRSVSGRGSAGTPPTLLATSGSPTGPGTAPGQPGGSNGVGSSGSSPPGDGSTPAGPGSPASGDGSSPAGSQPSGGGTLVQTTSASLQSLVSSLLNGGQSGPGPGSGSGGS
jgi:RNA polymerase sigma factor (sigma-70 family)